MGQRGRRLRLLPVQLRPVDGLSDHRDEPVGRADRPSECADQPASGSRCTVGRHQPKLPFPKAPPGHPRRAPSLDAGSIIRDPRLGDRQAGGIFQTTRDRTGTSA